MKQTKQMPFLQQNTITREHLARSIRRYTSLNINKASEVVDDIIDSLLNAILSNKQVKIRLFGLFTIKKKKSRTGRNPKTMVEAEISARDIVKFKVAPTLKKRINDNIDNIGCTK
ncbi:MAG: Bacterial nucleoid DNA-binding protein IHF-alpha [Candidatus Midichloria mitochondrii]|uniref:Histone-like DNA-binding protein n=1 Tax=Midichloria mitochondrii (strain IricVA) TaxID=696127 RepID=F7XVY4_MIDMI|nr:HU family DNA-binding protein [Candidatus Midichloria mitochondrii]AEI88833.1 integration host factor, alpha subunit [Candidatus Midichloria mitochondrii IricVA]MDJ1256488.1 HU family DNA-binding protein [Candidatus Midichloria mitochondrii]MDJ1288203.1 HU family DNA-binding protein [Candidatus Midichloria mitochondrii]MDJ1299071.1 HU family DNA-binding protein [Candidatus Midichloria mitochondrii]MDJ1312986.1 HU family DNA-binding protein [Candidatus Midichloria mitochondrii]